MSKIVQTALAALAILGFAGAAEAKRQPPEARLAKVLKGRVAGEPRDCIFLPSVRSTQIIDRTAIVYDAGNVVWVNRPRSGASTLDSDDILVTRPHGPQLCSVDIVHLRSQSGYFTNGFVGLGEFVPYRKLARAN